MFVPFSKQTTKPVGSNLSTTTLQISTRRQIF